MGGGSGPAGLQRPPDDDDKRSVRQSFLWGMSYEGSSYGVRPMRVVPRGYVLWGYHMRRQESSLG